MGVHLGWCSCESTSPNPCGVEWAECPARPPLQDGSENHRNEICFCEACTGMLFIAFCFNRQLNAACRSNYQSARPPLQDGMFSETINGMEWVGGVVAALPPAPPALFLLKASGE